MVLSISTIEALGIKEASELEAFWSHSIYTALCAKFLTKKFEPLLEPGQIWIGALLHDIGKLIYFKFYPDHYNYIVKTAKMNGELYEDIEQQLSIPSSAYLGALLCKRWGLPTVVADACESNIPNRVAGEDATISDYKKIIYGANLMAVFATNELSSETKKGIFNSLSSLFKIDEDSLLELMGKIYDLKQDGVKYKW